jgi:ketosteroid isomerase-like protein
VNREDIDRWLADYVEAWMTYDRGKIEGLFAEDIAYRYHPWDEPIQGRDAIVQSWIDERDEPGTYEGDYRAVAVDGDVAIATGTSTYFAEPGGPVDRIYDNCYVMRFDSEGRCSEFTEWYMKRPSE